MAESKFKKKVYFIALYLNWKKEIKAKFITSIEEQSELLQEEILKDKELLHVRIFSNPLHALKFEKDINRKKISRIEYGINQKIQFEGSF